MSTRIKAVKELLRKFTLCKDSIFDCSDPSLRPGHFERISALDIKPSQEEEPSKIHSLLKARSRINLRLKIAEHMAQQLKPQVDD